MNNFFSKIKKIKYYVFAVAAIAVFMFFSAADASADYYNWGVLVSDNVLSGADITAITGFNVTADIPANTAVSIQFSQDLVNYYSSTSTLWAWDICADGTTNIDLTGLGWSGGLLFYKLKLATTDAAATPSVTDIQVDYDGTEVPADSGIRYPNEGTLVSTDLLAGIGGTLNGSEKFGYNITSLPAGTAVYVQFSRDAINWYSSTSTQWYWDTLSTGDHLESGALDLSGLHWSGDNFYYKLRFTTVDDQQTPVVSEVKLLRSATIINAPQTNLMADDGLVGYWSFNGADMNWASTTAEALDRSGNSNNGNVVNGAKPVSGISGQAMQFDGVDDYVNNGDVLNLSLPITISAWVKADSFRPTYGNGIFTSDNASLGSSFNHSGIKLSVGPTGLLNISYGDNTACAVAGRRTKVSATSLTTGKWYHVVAISRGATDMSLYINGIDAGGTYSGAGGNLVNTSRLAGIGMVAECSNGSNINWDGLIDEARVYNRALSAEEIGELYRSGAKKMQVNAPQTNLMKGGLVGYWSFNGQDMGTTSARDLSGNNNTGWLMNGAKKVSGISGQALQFDGVDDYAEYLNKIEFNNNDFTISAWAYMKGAPGGPSGYNPIYSQRVDGTGNGQPAVNLYFETFANGKKPTLQVRDNVGATVTISADDAGIYGQWYHIVGIKTSSNLSLYVNGILAASPMSHSLSGDFDAGSIYKNLGRFKWSGIDQSFFNGILDEVRVYNRALSAEEIGALYRAGARRVKY